MFFVTELGVLVQGVTQVNDFGKDIVNERLYVFHMKSYDEVKYEGVRGCDLLFLFWKCLAILWVEICNVNGFEERMSMSNDTNVGVGQPHSAQGHIGTVILER